MFFTILTAFEDEQLEGSILTAEGALEFISIRFPHKPGKGIFTFVESLFVTNLFVESEYKSGLNKKIKGKGIFAFVESLFVTNLFVESESKYGLNKQSIDKRLREKLHASDHRYVFPRY
jgi:hypothetical protein